MNNLMLVGVAALAAPVVAVAGVGLGEFAKGRIEGPVVPYSVPAGLAAPPRIGTNIGPLAYYDTAMPFLDLMKSSGGWLPQRPGQWDTGERLGLDADGWVRSVPRDDTGKPAELGLLVLSGGSDAAPAHARYVVFYEGAGTIEGTGGATTVESRPGRALIRASESGFLQLRIDSDPGGTGNHLHDIRVVREDKLDAHRRGELYDPVFLEKMRGFASLRFMDFMQTNLVYRRDGRAVDSQEAQALLGAGELSWADRPLMDDAHWDRGVPVEAMVELANELDSEPWFNMPVNAGDDYVRNFARYVKEHLDPHLAVHVELSNEVWNFSFPQAHYAKARAEQAFGPDANWMEWYGIRTAQVGAIWNRVFGEAPTGSGDPGRVRVVFGTQFVYKGVETPALESPNWTGPGGRHQRAAEYFDEYAVASYYTGGFHESGNAFQVMSWWNLPDGGYQRALDTMWREFAETQQALFPYHGEQARRYGLDLVTYEAGYGEFTPYSQHDNDRYTDFLIELQRRPEIYELDMANAQAFADAGGTLFMNFQMIGVPSKWGSWGALESIGQETSPRYRALQELIRQSKGPKLRRKYATRQVSIDCRAQQLKSLRDAWHSGEINDASPVCGQSGA